MDASEIKTLLNQRAEEYCRWLFPNGKRHGDHWHVGNISGDAGDSLKIALAGEHAGNWRDWADSGKSGDLLSLTMEARGTTSFGKCLVDIKSWLGLPINGDEDRTFFQQKRNGGKFETPSPCYARLNPDGPVYRWLVEERLLDPATLEIYRVCEHADMPAVGFAHIEDGKLRAIKYRPIVRPPGGADQWADPKGAALGLWGKHAIPESATGVVITEGQIDALTLAGLGFAVVSMPNGALDDKWIERDWKWLERFASITLCYDADKAGQDGLAKAWPALLNRLGRHRCLIATLPPGIKDANQAAKDGREDELQEAVDNAASVDPETLRHLSSYRDEVEELFFPKDAKPEGFACPWTDRLRFRPSEVTIWSGMNGHGKTTVLLQYVSFLCCVHRERVVVACMEAPARKTGQILSRQCAGKAIGDLAHFRSVYDRVAENIWIYDQTGTASWRDLLNDFRYAFRRYCVRHFVIDSIMTCNIDTDDYNQQSQFINAAAEFAKEVDGHVHVVAHSKKREDEAKAPGKMDVAGHANLTNRAFNGLTVHRNMGKLTAIKEGKPDSLDLHDAELICWKQRETGDLFHLRLWMDKPSLQFWPSKEIRPRSYQEGVDTGLPVYPAAVPLPANFFGD